MKNTVIIIPARLAAKRFPNKPLALIKGTPMIVHVLNRAKETKIEKVVVATPDSEIIDVVEKNGGQAIFTQNTHTSGSDRVYEAYIKNFSSNADLIINVQGDMPNINPSSILHLEKHMKKGNCEIGTLAINLQKDEINNPHVVKVQVDEEMTTGNFLIAKDFFRKKKDLKNEKIYHQIGIYAFTKDALTKYVKLPKSRLEIDRDLEQMRAFENNMTIRVSLCDSNPVSVDTQEGLKKLIETMN